MMVNVAEFDIRVTRKEGLHKARTVKMTVTQQCLVGRKRSEASEWQAIVEYQLVYLGILMQAIYY